MSEGDSETERLEAEIARLEAENETLEALLDAVVPWPYQVEIGCRIVAALQCPRLAEDLAEAARRAGLLGVRVSGPC